MRGEIANVLAPESTGTYTLSPDTGVGFEWIAQSSVTYDISSTSTAYLTVFWSTSTGNAQVARNGTSLTGTASPQIDTSQTPTPADATIVAAAEDVCGHTQITVTFGMQGSVTPDNGPTYITGLQTGNCSTSVTTALPGPGIGVIAGGASAAIGGIALAGLAASGGGGAYTVPSLPEPTPGQQMDFGSSFYGPDTLITMNPWEPTLPPLPPPPGGSGAAPAQIPELPPPTMKMTGEICAFPNPGGKGDPYESWSRNSEHSVAGFVNVNGGSGPYTVVLHFGDGTTGFVEGGSPGSGFVSFNHTFPHAGLWQITAQVQSPGSGLQTYTCLVVAQ